MRGRGSGRVAQCVAGALLAVLVVGGCNDAEGGGGGNGGGNGGDGGGGGGGNGAPGSPVDVPSVPDPGQPIDDIRDGITSVWVDACGGELCVDLQYEDGTCFQGFDPSSGTVERGSTVTVKADDACSTDSTETTEPTETTETEGTATTQTPEPPDDSGE